jgi:hypothetical protein
MPATLLASNQSAVFIKTQANVGVPETISGSDAVRVIGTPSWSVRGAGIIDRKEVFTPWGGSSASRTGGLGWDITFQTELFWRFDQNWDQNLANQGQLKALFNGSPFNVSHPSLQTQLSVQPFFNVDTTKNVVHYTTMPFTIVYEEENGKRFEAYDCVCIPKFSWEYGQRVIIDWTIKGKWYPVLDSQNLVATYASISNEAPIIGVNCGIQLTGILGGAAVTSVSKVTIDTGWAISDVADTLQQWGFGVGFVRLDTAPTIELDIADLDETAQPTWGDAEANTIGTDLLLYITVGTYSIVFNLLNPQLMAFPTPGELNGYRNETLKFQSIPDSASYPLTIKFTALN